MHDAPMDLRQLRYEKVETDIRPFRIDILQADLDDLLRAAVSHLLA
jgi:hypothetical protein